MRIVFIAFLLLFILNDSAAQDWNITQSFGGIGNESLDELSIMDNGQYLLGGNFEDNFIAGNNSLNATGEEDVYCSIYNGDGSHHFSFQMGGLLEDQLSGITSSGNAITLFGSYSIQADFDTIQLNTSLGSKGLFISQYNTLGEVQWAHSIDGNILSIGGDIISDANGDIIITGYFYDSLLFQQDTLLANSSEGDLFVIKLDINGNLIWSTQAGDDGIMRSTALTIDAQSNIIIAGKFKGDATFNTDIIQTNTADSDVFIAKLDPEGNFLWGKKLGGVFEDDLSAIAVDNNGNIYLTGHFLGVMSSIDGWTMQTTGINLDAYLIKMDTNGNVIWGFPMGGTNDDFSTDISIFNDKIALTGYFQTSTYWGFNGLVSEGAFDACIAVFDLDGDILNMLPISGDDLEIGFRIHYTSSGQLLAGGAFNTSCVLGSDNFNALGGFDVYWGLLGISVKNDELILNDDFHFHPNPASDWIYWNDDPKLTIHLYDIMGRKLLSSGNGEMNVSYLSNGIYFLGIEGKPNTQKIIIQH